MTINLLRVYKQLLSRAEFIHIIYGEFFQMNNLKKQTLTHTHSNEQKAGIRIVDRYSDESEIV